MADRALHDDTLLTHAGNRPRETHGVVNPPVYRTSTVLFPTIEAYDTAYRNRFAQTTYGRYGTPTTFALEEVHAGLEDPGDLIADLDAGFAGLRAAA